MVFSNLCYKLTNWRIRHYLDCTAGCKRLWGLLLSDAYCIKIPLMNFLSWKSAQWWELLPLKPHGGSHMIGAASIRSSTSLAFNTPHTAICVGILIARTPDIPVYPRCSGLPAGDQPLWAEKLGPTGLLDSWPHNFVLLRAVVLRPLN